MKSHNYIERPIVNNSSSWLKHVKAFIFPQKSLPLVSDPAIFSFQLSSWGQAPENSPGRISFAVRMHSAIALMSFNMISWRMSPFHGKLWENQ